MKARRILTQRQKLFGLMLQDQVAFMRFFFKEDLSHPPSTRQKLLWNDVSKRVLAATGRKIFKTGMIEARIIRKSLGYRNRKRISERMFATPGDKQLVPVVSRLMTKIEFNPLFKLMRAGWNKNDGMLKWRTNTVWHMRIDGTAGDDRNMVGLRLDEILFDEAAFTTRICHSSRKQSALPGCDWLYTGVPNSVRNTPFYELDQVPSKGRGWSHHKTSTYTNPLYWADSEKKRLQEDYTPGSPDYTTQVMGCWGVELYSSFPPDAMLILDALPYRICALKPSDLPREITIDALARTRLAAKIQLPKVTAYQYVVGGDYGFLQDPAEFGVAYRDSEDTKEWRMLSRIEVKGVDPLTQAYLLHMLVEMLGREKVGAVCLDLQHAGLAISLELTKPGSIFPIDWWRQALVDLNSGGIVEVIDPRDEMQRIKVGRKQFVTQQLQAALLAAKANLTDNFRLVLGNDEDLFQELVDTREQKMPSGRVTYIARTGYGHSLVDHSVDLLRCIVTGANWAMENSIGDTGGGPDAQGWAGNPFRKTWQAPWGERVGIGY